MLTALFKLGGNRSLRLIKRLAHPPPASVCRTPSALNIVKIAEAISRRGSGLPSFRQMHQRRQAIHHFAAQASMRSGSSALCDLASSSGVPPGNSRRHVQGSADSHRWPARDGAGRNSPTRRFSSSDKPARPVRSSEITASWLQSVRAICRGACEAVATADDGRLAPAIGEKGNAMFAETGRDRAVIRIEMPHQHGDIPQAIPSASNSLSLRRRHPTSSARSPLLRFARWQCPWSRERSFLGRRGRRENCDSNFSVTALIQNREVSVSNTDSGSRHPFSANVAHSGGRPSHSDETKLVSAGFR